MADAMTRFLCDLSLDVGLLEEFRGDPRGALDRAGLSAEQKEILLGDRDALQRALAPQGAPQGGGVPAFWPKPGPGGMPDSLAVAPSREV